MSVTRADPFDIEIDLGDFKPNLGNKLPVTKEAVRAVSEANDFPSRAPSSIKAGSKADSASFRQTPDRSIARRRRTGRNVQFNIKVTPETMERFVAISDAQGWVFGETLERALEALEQQNKVRAPIEKKR